MASLVLFDLDLEEDLSKVYKDAQDTIEYLKDLVSSIEKRVLSGETINGLQVVDGRKSRVITEPGFKYLSKVLGEKVVYEEIKKPITITKLEALVSKEDMEDLILNGYVAYQESAKKVALK